MHREKIGKYKVLGLAGKGAFGIVWHGQSTEDSKHYAIKEIKKKNMTVQLLENLVREVQISQKLDHPNVVKCFTSLESKSNYYIVMEFCTGGDLGNYLEQRKSIPLPEVIHLMRQLRDAYKYLLHLNILHRDIKLDNILLAEKGKMHIKLSDFGCSKVDPFGQTEIGTPKYMALEILDNLNSYNYKIDLWSIGLCFWELAYGHGAFPFKLTSKEQLISDIKNFSGDRLRFPKDQPLPPAFADFFRSILQLSPQLRMDAKDFLEHPVFELNEASIAQELEALRLDGGPGGSQRKSGSGGGISPDPSSKDLGREPADLGLLTGEKTAFSHVKKSYNEKIYEVTLMTNVVKRLLKFLDPSWEKQFPSYSKCPCLIIANRAHKKAEVAFGSLHDGKNVFELADFEQFVQFPNECLPLKDQIKAQLDGLKKMDDEIYNQLINECFDASYFDEINQNLYKGHNPSTKKNFIINTYQYVKKNGPAFIKDYDKNSFDTEMKRTYIVLKGEVLQKTHEFH